MDISLQTSIKDLYAVGKTTYKRFENLGLLTVRDLLFYFPTRYEDYSKIVPINELQVGEHVTVRGIIELVENKRSYRRKMVITQAIVDDGTARMKVIWFHQPYLTKVLKQGQTILFAGKVEAAYEGSGVQFSNPVYEVASQETTHTGRLVPVYPLTGNLTQKQVRFLTKVALQAVGELEEYLPDEILEDDFLALWDALHQIHFPKDNTYLTKALDRLKFDEFFFLQLRIAAAKQVLDKEESYPLTFFEKDIQDFVKTLPFTLTDSQKVAAYRIMLDLQNKRPMNRLLEGDVGSGKTVVATLASYLVFLNKKQVAFMAPTEILVKQHFATVQKFFKGVDMTIALYTRTNMLVLNPTLQEEPSKVTKAQLMKRCEKGDVDIIIGTHSLLNDDLRFAHLSLVVIDEQHRFGVGQRKLLKQKNLESISPHLLSMTATPIPRSLALVLYGDLSISLLKGLPPGRKPVQTRVVFPKQRKECVEFIRKQLQEGRQMFYICPLIDISDTLGIISAKEAFDMLKNGDFKEFRIGLLHGKMKGKEKESVMNEFRTGKLDILVSTAVIEVGVDVPNATVMVIDGSQRFGLASLHQFRGRVGRSSLQSYCFLFAEYAAGKSKQRLMLMQESTDGFYLAQKDLEMRGPGEVYGYKQSGLPELKLATLYDEAILQRARDWAAKILDSGVEKYPPLLKTLEDYEKSLHLE